MSEQQINIFEVVGLLRGQIAQAKSLVRYGQVKPHQIRALRKELARVLTKINQELK